MNFYEIFLFFLNYEDDLYFGNRLGDEDVKHQSTNDENNKYEVHYSDGSYNTIDDDKLYETFVDDGVE